MDKIEEFFVVYKNAAWNKDVNQMVGLYHENVVIFDMWEHGFQKGLEAWSLEISNWLGSLGDEKVKVDFEMISVQEKSTVGFASAVVSFQAVGLDQTILRGMKNRISLGFIRDEIGWKVVHQHTSAPIDSNLQVLLDF
ncbi:nuclear transport factor 2 family protein [Algoriphagus pacificus]|uniref:Nuclear transport factor 2 family protein n=1 Tax=Algoriphagus pacificus TaxID=2811234 RepID=A0ABS3CJ81_9BACT|nr:nuclear transport factor 2 family protein [Algoriphagus pacificus]MBN7816295.1 nuclear transport factor 2 family protein [Algoriphagus pacificus]